MATIRKRGDRWQVQVRRVGFPSQSKSFVSKRDALTWARQREQYLDRDELPADRTILFTTTLGDLVTRYRHEVTPSKKGASAETYVLAAFLRQSICRKSLAHLLPSDFAHYRDERLQTVSPATLRRQLNPLHNMFEVARTEWDLPLKENPLDGLRLTLTNTKRQRRISESEFLTLTKAAERSRNKLVLDVVLFAIETAMRRGEILAMGWSDVDLLRRSVTIREAKNGHTRVIPLTQGACRILERQERSRSQCFPITANALRLAWERLRTRACLVDFHFHDLRHEGISRLFEKGLSVPEVALISGHRDASMLLRYAHSNLDRVQSLID